MPAEYSNGSLNTTKVTMKSIGKFQQIKKLTFEGLKAIRSFVLISLSIWVILQAAFVYNTNPRKWPFWESAGMFIVSAGVFLLIIYVGILLLNWLSLFYTITMPNLFNCILGSIIGMILIKVGGVIVGTIFYLVNPKNPTPLNEKISSSLLFYIPIIITLSALAYTGWKINDLVILERK